MFASTEENLLSAHNTFALVNHYKFVENPYVCCAGITCEGAPRYVTWWRNEGEHQLKLWRE